MAITEGDVSALLDEAAAGVARDIRNWGTANSGMHNDPYEYARGAEYVMNAVEVRLLGTRNFQREDGWKRRRAVINSALCENPVLKKLHDEEWFATLRRTRAVRDEDEQEFTLDEEDDDEWEF